MDGVQRGRGESEEAALRDVRGPGDRDDPLPRHHDRPRRRAEQAVGVEEAAGTGNEHPLPHRPTGPGTGLGHSTRGFVARHQWVAQPREWRHSTGPEQSLRAGAHPGPVDLDYDVVWSRRRQAHGPKLELLRLFEYDSQRFHGPPSGLSGQELG
jgi:hypothetical protein